MLSPHLTTAATHDSALGRTAAHGVVAGRAVPSRAGRRLSDRVPASVLHATIERLEPRELMSFGDALGPTPSGAVDTLGPTPPVMMQGAAAYNPFMGAAGGWVPPRERTLSLPTTPASAGGFSGSGDNGHSISGIAAFRNDPRFTQFRGAGFSSVVIDTGIFANHPWFGPDANNDGVADRVVYQYDFARDLTFAVDTDDHGSNVAGAIASGSAQFPGVAPESDIIALGVFDSSGRASFGTLERALRWVITNATTYNVASVNLSLGDGQNYTQTFVSSVIGDELATLAQMGVIVVAAAGNSFWTFSGQPGLTYPAADPNVISVGAVYDSTGTYTYGDGAQGTASPGSITPFSQRASWMDIFAPGAPITGPGPGGGTTTMHGTSQASPMVAGVAVLAQQIATALLGRRLSFGEFRQLLADSATVIWDSPTADDGAREVDNVENTGLSYRMVNMLALADRIYSMSGPPSVTQQPNVAPTLGAIQALPNARSDRPALVKFASLIARSDAADANNDLLMFRVDQLVSGVLTVNGRTAIAGVTTIRPGDVMVWFAAPDSVGMVQAFTLKAFDGRALSAGAATVTFEVRLGRGAVVDLGSGAGLGAASTNPAAVSASPAGANANPAAARVNSPVATATPTATFRTAVAPSQPQLDFVQPAAPARGMILTQGLLAAESGPAFSLPTLSLADMSLPAIGQGELMSRFVTAAESRLRLLMSVEPGTLAKAA